MINKKKALITASVPSFIAAFESSDVSLLQGLGYEVHIATNFEYDKNDYRIYRLDELSVRKHKICYERNPFDKKNLVAYKKLKKIIANEKFDLIHCHTPVVAALVRMAAGRYRCQGTKIIYTAHGFHFYKGAPVKNWIMYYPVEWSCSWLTDVLITINQEDYQRARKHLHAKKNIYVPGVGIDLKKFGHYDSAQSHLIEVNCRQKKREELQIPQNAILMISVGELSVRKNHRIVMEAIDRLSNSDLYYVIAGTGNLESDLREWIERKKFSENIKLLGYRSDIKELLEASDIFILPSLQEGLSVALMEAMATGLPCIASNIRGNVDLLDNKKLLFNPYDKEALVKAIEYVLSSDRQLIVNHNKSRIQKFDISDVKKKMFEMYVEVSEIRE